jgi:xyloglucan fucosyltransferase
MMSRRGALSFSRFKPPRRPYSCGALAIVFAMGLTTLLLFGLESKHVKFLSHMSGIYIQGTRMLNRKEIPEYPVTDVPSLIQAIKQATEKISGPGQPTELTDLERADWRTNHPCQSRTELEPFYTRRKFVKHVRRNPKWDAVLKEYATLHRACLQKIDWNATKYFLERNDSSGCKFAVAGGPGWAGLGNKVLPTLTVLLYAVLTQRVLLVPAASRLPEIMCEPFEGSSWGIDPERLFTPSENHEDVWKPFSDFESLVDATTFSSTHSKLYAVRPASWCQPVPRFFCDTEQAILQTQVPWLYFQSCILFMPKLFAIPAFQPVLEDLFPDRMATTHIIRSVMYPADPVWTRVKHVDTTHLRHAERRLGVQIRYRDLAPQFQEVHTTVNSRVVQCALSHGILNTTTPASAQPTTTIFITSLFPDLRDELTELFSATTITQLSQGAVQKFGLEEDVQALAEVMCLSFSDDLFVTPLSTFGGMAQAYGAVTPYFLEYRNDTALPPCERGQTVDPCHQDPEMEYICPHDRRVDGKTITEVVSAIRACPVIDTPRGVQLVSIDRSFVDEETASLS